MPNAWLPITFATTLLMNIIGFLGTLSLIYWVGDLNGRLVRNYHDQIQYAISLVYIIYVFAQYAINIQFRPAIFQIYLVFTNVLICASFVYCMLMISRAYWAITAVMTAGFMWLVYGFTVPALIAWLVEVAVQGVLSLHGEQIWDRRAIIYPLLIIYAMAGISGVILVQNRDAGYWIREVVALVIDGVIFYEYARLIVKGRLQANQFRAAATTDSMTGLKNFGSFNEDLSKRFNQFAEDGKPYALFELDIDHFKRVNDLHGHLIGNDVLIRVAQTITEYATELESTAAVYRMGGEEFGLLVTAKLDVDNHGIIVGEELRHRIRALRFDSPQGQFGVTVSIGEDISSASDHNYIAIYNRTDHFLYDAKFAGRDRINVRGHRLSVTESQGNIPESKQV